MGAGGAMGAGQGIEHQGQHHGHHGHHHDGQQHGVGEKAALGGAAGGLAGQEGHHGHTGRDAAAGAGATGLAAHEYNQHEQHKHAGTVGHDHTARDATLGGAAGGLTGHKGHNSQTGRDAAIGAGGAGLAGHELHKHEENKLHKQDYASGTSDATGATGATGTNTATKPGLGDKLGGAIQKGVGKMTNDPAMVEEGQLRKTGQLNANAVSGNADYAAHQAVREQGNGATTGTHGHPAGHATNMTGTNDIKESNTMRGAQEVGGGFNSM